MLVLRTLGESRGLSFEHLLEGTGLAPAYFSDRSHWVAWSTFLRALDNVAVGLTVEELHQLGRDGFNTPLTDMFRVVAPILPSELSVFRWTRSMATGPNALFYRCLRMDVRELTPTQLEVEIEVPAKSDLRVLGPLFYGAFEQMPRFCGAPRAKVRLQYTPQGLLYQVELQPRWRVLTALRQYWNSLFNRREAIEAQQTYQLLLQQNEALRRQMQAVRVAEEQRLQLEEGLRRSQRLEAVGRLAGGVAHDFNNLLTVILAHSGFLADQLPKSSELHENVKGIENASMRAAGLTRQLLAFSRQQVFELENVDVVAILRGVERILRTLLGEQHALVLDPGDQPLVFRGDKGQLEQVLMNLVVNASHAMGSRGTVTISVRLIPPADVPNLRGQPKEGSWIRLSVTDTGTGIDAETLELIFEPFFTTKGDDGTGLGLATVHGIVHQFGGTMDVESEVGTGTSVHVYLPCSEPVVATVEDPSISLHPPCVRGQLVLVVDDDSGVRRVLTRGLERVGYRTLEAASGDEGLRLATDRPDISVVLSDLVMPGLSGRELVQRLAYVRPELPVILMSGYAQGASSTEELGATAFLDKPFSRDALVKTLDDVLRQASDRARVKSS